ncbi:hypothetical protein [Catenulispora subtropica]|uniref:Uncharacterized protein n=1 Tax=Catenulispora subtropica TaxID=450798 RepID=A0ABP5CG39_9ACTN
MTTVSGTNDVSYLYPLFAAVDPYRSADHMLMLPPVQPGSSLAADDAPLGSWNVTRLVTGSISIGLTHVDTVRRLVAELNVLDTASPWTLMRGALEDFATAVYLLHGTRPERQLRALTLWNDDLRNRALYEDDMGHVATGKAKTGRQRQAEIQALAASLGFAQLNRPQVIIDTIKQAAGIAGMNPARVAASWRLGSGFAHGKAWSTMAGSVPRSIVPDPRGGHVVEFEVSDAPLQALASACLGLLKCAEAQYGNRRVK